VLPAECLRCPRMLQAQGLVEDCGHGGSRGFGKLRSQLLRLVSSNQRRHFDETCAELDRLRCQVGGRVSGCLDAWVPGTTGLRKCGRFGLVCSCKAHLKLNFSEFAQSTSASSLLP